MVLLQPDSISDAPGRGGKHCNSGVDLQTKRKYTEDDANQRKKENPKAAYETSKGTETKIGKIPMVVRTTWERAGKLEGNLKVYTRRTC